MNEESQRATFFPAPSGIITLTTDYGLADAYVASMKAVILSTTWQCTLVDVSHAIDAQQVADGAYLLGSVWRYFPAGTIHVAVVDPGVGTQRRGIILATPDAYFVAPDNGLLSYVIAEHLGQEGIADLPDQREGDLFVPSPVTLGPSLQAIVLTEPRFWRPTVSTTFHGRDVFAPVAAHLALGQPLTAFGEPTPWIMAFPVPRPTMNPDGSFTGHIIHVDDFGNLITDIPPEQLAGRAPVIRIGGRRIRGLSTTYAEADELLALVGSSGRVEIAVRNGNAARLLDLGLGDQLFVELPG